MLPNSTKIYNTEQMKILSFDFSTQSLTFGIFQLNERAKTCEELYINKFLFDTLFPEFETSNGYNLKQETGEATLPVFMILKAIDKAFQILSTNTSFLPQVDIISGCAQQHGTVYLTTSGISCLQELDKVDLSNRTLANIFQKEDFGVLDCPMWADSSTIIECQEINSYFIKMDKLFDLSGSKAELRFPAAQIRKLSKTKSKTYENTAQICLISSFLSSILAAKLISFDYSEASMTNLFSLENKKLIEGCETFCAPNISQKLKLPPVECSETGGYIANYFLTKYGIKRTCKVSCFTGDNPSSLLGLLGFKKEAKNNDREILISLGTSDTLFFEITEQERKNLKQSMGHIFFYPTNSNRKMFMLCYKNGSVTREYFKIGSWKKATADLENFFKSNELREKYIGLCFAVPEITPCMMQIDEPMFFDVSDVGKKVDEEKFASNQKLYICILSRFLAMRSHMERVSSFEKFSKVVVTGGGSKNDSILQIIEWVFQLPVFISKVSAENSACLGGAIKVSPFEIEVALKRKSLALIENDFPTSLLSKYQDLEDNLIKKLIIEKPS